MVSKPPRPRYRKPGLRKTGIGHPDKGVGNILFCWAGDGAVMKKHRTLSRPPPPPPKTEDQKSDGDESTPKASDGWYYASEGEKHGPVEPPELIGLLANGVIGRDTIVWQHGMSDWIPLDQTEVWASISENQTKLLASISEGDSPPPLPPAYVSDKLAWIIAFVPLIIPLLFSESRPTHLFY